LLPKRARVQLRTVFLIAVIMMLFVDAFYFSGATTQAAYAQLVSAGKFIVSLISGVIDSVKPTPDS
jgi:drug/metabolite transporter (DMT)-like permease